MNAEQSRPVTGLKNIIYGVFALSVIVVYFYIPVQMVPRGSQPTLPQFKGVTTFIMSQENANIQVKGNQIFLPDGQEIPNAAVIQIPNGYGIRGVGAKCSKL